MDQSASSSSQVGSGSSTYTSKEFPGVESIKVDEEVYQNEEGFNDYYYDSFDETWSQLEDILKNVPRKKGTKRTPKEKYEQIMQGLSLQSKEIGFTKEELLLIWKVAYRDDHLNCTQRRTLIFLMLPCTKVEHQVLKQIVNQYQEGSKDHRPTVILAVLQLLILYIQYRLLDETTPFTEEMLTKIITAKTDNFVISWKMRLFRHFMTPDNLSTSHIEKLNQFLRIKDLKQTQVDDVLAVLGACKFIRPDVFHNGETIPWKVRAIKFPRDVELRFYRCKLRTQEKIDGSLHPLADRVFPEFLPESYRWGSGPPLRRNLFELMLQYLPTKHGLTTVAHSAVLFHEFQQWIQPVINFRFHSFPATVTDEDLRRYVFIFERCIILSKAKREGIPVVNEWIIQFLPTWNFGVFKSFIFDLVPFLEPANVLANERFLSEALSSRFLYSPSFRFDIWDMLGNLYDRWITNPLSNSDGLDWVIDMMNKCVSSLVNAFGFAPQEMDTLITNICLTYRQMMKHAKEKLDLKHETRVKMSNPPPELITCVFLFKSRPGVKELAELVLFRSKENGEMDDFTLGFHAIMLRNMSNAVTYGDASSDEVDPTLKKIKLEIPDVKFEVGNDFSQQLISSVIAYRSSACL